MIVRHAPGLQRTRDALPPTARMNAATLARLDLAHGDTVRVSQGQDVATVRAALDPRVADGTVRLATACLATATLSSMTGPVRVAKA
jgi:NADH-quinone oxidoreductase subunit G